jgi:two-component system, cell cycle sensor histidine kinase and response regulator CckA
MTMNTATILLVDDERPVRRMTERMLQQGGYNVYSAENAGEAVTIAEELQERLDLLVTDMRMPGTNGHQLIGMIRRICPRAGTMAISGFLPEGIPEQDYPVLPKPFTKADLLGAVQQILDAQELKNAQVVG